jgi:hypothetical protein
MTTFDKREEAFEAKFAHDEELRFKAAARRNHFLADWAARQLGKKGGSVQNYIKELVDLGTRGDDIVFRKIREDFHAGGVNLSDHQIQRSMAEMMQTALHQLRDL